MRNRLLLIFALLFNLQLTAGNLQWLHLPSAAVDENAAVKVINATQDQTELRFTMKTFSMETVQTPSGAAYKITSTNLSHLLKAGAPDLGKMAFSLAIPDQAAMEVDQLNSTYTTYQNIDVAPSKGNLYRNTDPSSVPYTYGTAYSKNEFYPGKLVQLNQPYIVRDVRGQSVWVFPFQYNPVTKELRVYSEIHFIIKANGTFSVNALTRSQQPSKVDPSFAAIYRSRFVNNSILQYTPLEDAGSMLVICHDNFISAMQPFVDWKNKSGQRTEMVPFSSVGTTAADLKTYVENYYNNNGLTFVLLVGDGDLIPIGSTQYGESDAMLGYILGNDSYAEVIVGRFSAETVEDVETQVARTIAYEAFPDPTGQWYHKAVCIGSDQGPGDDNEMDYEHERNMRDDELGYTYTDADELYDGSEGGADANGDPGPQDVINSLNDGRSVITYTGHGSCGSFGTTSFSTNDVPALTNADMLPFIWAVACVNGQFNGYDCLAEAFMRATDGNGKATGAVATFMSTINQSWDPPMDAQDEFVDILTEQYGSTNIKRTFGGISVNGCMHMNDVYLQDGDEMTDTWTCFGDPSLQVRTATPLYMTVSHDLLIDEAATSFLVNCNTDGAYICLSKHNQVIATEHSLGGLCSLQNLSGLAIGDTLDVVATAFNMVPYFGEVIVTSMTAIQENNLDGNFSVYPAITSGQISISYSLEQPAPVQLELLNGQGQRIQTISDKQSGKGINKLESNLKGLSAGSYFIRLTVSGKTQLRKFIVL